MNGISDCSYFLYNSVLSSHPVELVERTMGRQFPSLSSTVAFPYHDELILQPRRLTVFFGILHSLLCIISHHVELYVLSSRYLFLTLSFQCFPLLTVCRDVESSRSTSFPYHNKLFAISDIFSWPHFCLLLCPSRYICHHGVKLTLVWLKGFLSILHVSFSFLFIHLCFTFLIMFLI